jgi:hypothetical protein
LAVPGTSVPSERVASVAGNIVSSKRARLNPHFVEQLAVSSMNWDFLENQSDLQEVVNSQVRVEEEVDQVFFLEF